MQRGNEILYYSIIYVFILDSNYTLLEITVKFCDLYFSFNGKITKCGPIIIIDRIKTESGSYSKIYREFTVKRNILFR